MGTVYKKTFTKPLPTGVKFIIRKGKRLAEWKDAKGKTRTAPLTVAVDRIAVEAGTYTAKYRDGTGIVQDVPTGCRDEQAARSVLADLERRAEMVKGKILTAAEDAIIDHQGTPLADHFASYLAHLEADGTTPEHRVNVNRCLHRIATDCAFACLGDFNREVFERWLVAQAKVGMGARTRNIYRAAAVAFCNWCLESGRLIVNPFAKVRKADEKADCRRQRRALTEAELVKLLDVARRRPLLDRMTVYRGKRKGEVYGVLREETRRRLELLGRGRALVYKTLVLTGLRKGELASLAAGQLDLNADPPSLVLDAADEKNREGSTIPLRSDLAADLREWLADRLQSLQDAARNLPPVSLDLEAGRDPGGRRGNAKGLTGSAAYPVQIAARCPVVRRSDRAAEDTQPGLESRRHPQTG